MRIEREQDQFVIYEEQHMVGKLRVVEDCTNHRRAQEGKRIYIQDVLIQKEYRRRGYATALINYVIAYYKDRKIIEVTIAVDSKNDAAKALYKKLGFNRLQVGFDPYQNRAYELLLHGEGVL